MKDIKKVGDPVCDFCGEPAVYDCPTNQGPWAYLCKECFKLVLPWVALVAMAVVKLLNSKR